MNTNQIKMYKNILASLTYLIYISLFARAVSYVDINNLQIIDVINVFGVIAFFVIFIKSLISPYLVLTTRELIIKKDYFKNIRIPRDKIEGYNEGAKVFSSSYFVTTDNKKIKFNSSALKEKDRKMLLNLFSKKDIAGETNKNGSQQ